MKLTIGERLKALKVLPKNSDIIFAKIVMTLQDKLGLTAEEKKDHNFRLQAADDNKGFVWRWDKEDKEYDIELSECEIDIIKEGLMKLNETKKIEVNKSMIALYEKIVK
jgi:hypothetical protein